MSIGAAVLVLAAAPGAHAECDPGLLCACARTGACNGAACTITGEHVLDLDCTLAIDARITIDSRATLRGPSFEFDATSLTVDGLVQSTGGFISLTTEEDLVLRSTGRVDADDDAAGGNEGGGEIYLEALSGNVGIAGQVTANATTPNGSGGIVTIVAGGAHAITVSGSVLARGGSGADGFGGSVTLGSACLVTISGTGTVNSRGGAGEGENDLFYAEGGLVVNGKLLANPFDADDEFGGNMVTCRGAGACETPPSLRGTVAPAAVVRPSLDPDEVPPCIECGNSSIDPGEQCDEGDTDPCDGCSPTCQIQNVGEACDISGPCFAGGTCTADGVCTGKPIDCDDGNPCTDDFCSGGCQHTFNAAPCDDRNACTTGDHCSQGRCVGTCAIGQRCPLGCEQGFCDATGPTCGCGKTLSAAVWLGPVMSFLLDDEDTATQTTAPGIVATPTTTTTQP